MRSRMLSYIFLINDSSSAILPHISTLFLPLSPPRSPPMESTTTSGKCKPSSEVLHALQSCEKSSTSSRGNEEAQRPVLRLWKCFTPPCPLSEDGSHSQRLRSKTITDLRQKGRSDLWWSDRGGRLCIRANDPSRTRSKLSNQVWRGSELEDWVS
ncbi:hypothetical protein MPTK1_4g17320 [Marchantia polymorpha subsp. ruderalis]|uniref:Uncharacterized protein n=2 Tax=Marchantia polymorpha TaxID=3197 RepID=A0AAF6BAU0_MARPO|nr:hypothetical protein MARPO_0041s0014 [Marchantia polymorpha]BBN09124.1 hypothetical protein Mp_4g17320 [Marchantia polymorpha subsp. ruderalis]|eukprot:PTQ40112.1 hypothetical protein MARPO_0041s0014 [Marchantia polymorpha]